jgi:16S rRNA (adenine1518-N6/adenine1519-N6)-dimethyltransferase
MDDDLIKTNKSLGQHWLNNRASLEAMCDAAEVDEYDQVLEVGPGPGSLTELLVARAKEVVAVELDMALAKKLEKRHIDNLIVINQSILKFNLNDLPKDYKLVANIPYYLTSNLIRIISESKNPPKVAAMLVQKEVAERLAAQPGKMSVLSVTAQFYSEITLGEVVEAYLFTPPPKVNSQIVILKRRNQPLFSDVIAERYFKIVKAGFSQKRKTILNSLSSGLHLDHKTVSTYLSQTGIGAKRRAQTLTLEEWHQLALIIT